MSTPDTPEIAENARREIVELHQFFASWMSGEGDEGDIHRFERVLADDFSLQGPDGDTHNRHAIIELVRQARPQPADAPSVSIEIRNVSLEEVREGLATVRYEEWQNRGEGWRGRRSIATFRPRPDTPHGIEWVSVRERWID